MDESTRNKVVTIQDGGRKLQTTGGEWLDALTREVEREEKAYRDERQQRGRARMSLKRRLGPAFSRAFNRLATQQVGRGEGE